MEREEWVNEENTRELLRYIKKEVHDLGMDALSGNACDQNNADMTQYMTGKVNGIYQAYRLITEYIYHGDGEEKVSPETEEYDG